MFDGFGVLVAYNDAVVLTKVVGHDDWQKPVYGAPVAMDHVRIDRGAVYSGTNNDRQIVANAVIYIRCFANLEIPALDDSWLQGMASFDDKKYTITAVNVLKDASGMSTWGYELEVL
ncbi:putative minor capsid protein [Schleiferilactobacillus perolens]|uniref:Capsid protein n=1 Tax=Schleiferilactobacillus perolens DSM 12744 TaxID=1423792 RepID=A0A0R1MRL7_9LACO|nr:putative minor capsid protein [Schleiferilactobacillus perolens]KRL10734.1 hypothetical protein FD09_GL000877 [Schleiferilactobacillus perolens DSM 12744]